MVFIWVQKLCNPHMKFRLPAHWDCLHSIMSLLITWDLAHQLPITTLKVFLAKRTRTYFAELRLGRKRVMKANDAFGVCKWPLPNPYPVPFSSALWHNWATKRVEAERQVETNWKRMKGKKKKKKLMLMCVEYPNWSRDVTWERRENQEGRAHGACWPIPSPPPHLPPLLK